VLEEIKLPNWATHRMKALRLCKMQFAADRLWNAVVVPFVKSDASV
jgi:hypothetical protein